MSKTAGNVPPIFLAVYSLIYYLVGTEPVGFRFHARTVRTAGSLHTSWLDYADSLHHIYQSNVPRLNKCNSLPVSMLVH